MNATHTFWEENLEMSSTPSRCAKYVAWAVPQDTAATTIPFLWGNATNHKKPPMVC